MEALLRPLVVYAFLVVVLRLVGKRQLASITVFDFVLILIVAEAVQGAMVDNEDRSITVALLVVLTLVGTDLALSFVKRKFKRADRWVEGVPVVLVDDGKPVRVAMDRERVAEEDILASARMSQGLERMDQVRYAILENDGTISIVPK
ncbi:MAG TPA: YetF domain-containing protein [Candidatus Thermoplasmatota archaeon]|nr:YetF domain-containing protein [Candidatus Thermoplasmatota archaeon]